MLKQMQTVSMISFLQVWFHFFKLYLSLDFTICRKQRLTLRYTTTGLNIRINWYNLKNELQN